jgi:hypothetical protein
LRILTTNPQTYENHSSFNHHHFSTYPVGCGLPWSLLALTVAALAATSYGTASCRLVVVTFASVGTNSFEEHFAPDHTTVSDDVHEMTNAIGLFHWLRPVLVSSSPPSSSPGTIVNGTTTGSNDSNNYDWTEGACAGYQQSMLDALLGGANPYFTIGRILAITALLLGGGMLLWAWSTACVALTNRFQGGLLLCLALVGAACTVGAVGSALRSSLCTADNHAALFARPPHCTIDQGGLIMLGASLLWLCIALIAACYIMPGIAAFAAEQDAEDEWRAEAAPYPDGRRHRMPREIRIITTATTAPEKAASRPRSSPPLTKSHSTAELMRRAEQQFDRFLAHSKTLLRRNSNDNDNNGRTKTRTDAGVVITTIDDTETDSDGNGGGATEVYIANRLDRIEKLTDV